MKQTSDWEQVAAAHPILRDDFASEWMGITVIHAHPGDVRIEMSLREEMLNGFGIAHGGMIFAFADTAFALCCNDATSDDGTITVASGADINFLRPAHRGQRLIADARVVSAGRSGLYDITVTAIDPAATSAEAGSQVVAQFRGRSRTIPAPAPINTPAPTPTAPTKE